MATRWGFRVPGRPQHRRVGCEAEAAARLHGPRALAAGTAASLEGNVLTSWLTARIRRLVVYERLDLSVWALGSRSASINGHPSPRRTANGPMFTEPIACGTGTVCTRSKYLRRPVAGFLCTSPRSLSGLKKGLGERKQMSKQTRFFLQLVGPSPPGAGGPALSQVAGCGGAAGEH